MWWLDGFEAQDHAVSFERVQHVSVSRPEKLPHLDRFRRIRNDASYRGEALTKADAEDILQAWALVGDELLSYARSGL